MASDLSGFRAMLFMENQIYRASMLPVSLFRSGL